jgi:predicted nucleic acid-binding Zn ribbon protein
MPKYMFECQTEGCCLRFERNLKMGDWPSHECPKCHEVAPRVLESFDFGFKETPGKIGNSGVHKEDYPTADHAVGRDAENRWAYYAERDKVKAQARAQGETPALIRRTGPGYVDYEPMSDAGREARRGLTKKALSRLAAAREARGPR